MTRQHSFRIKVRPRWPAHLHRLVVVRLGRLCRGRRRIHCRLLGCGGCRGCCCCCRRLGRRSLGRLRRDRDRCCNCRLGGRGGVLGGGREGRRLVLLVAHAAEAVGVGRTVARGCGAGGWRWAGGEGNFSRGEGALRFPTGGAGGSTSCLRDSPPETAASHALAGLVLLLRGGRVHRAAAQQAQERGDAGFWGGRRGKTVRNDGRRGQRGGDVVGQHGPAGAERVPALSRACVCKCMNLFIDAAI